MRSAARLPSERLRVTKSAVAADEPPCAFMTLRRLAADRCAALPEPLLGTRRRVAPLRRGQEAPSGRTLRRSPPPPPLPAPPLPRSPAPARTPAAPLEPQNGDRVTASMPTTVDYGVRHWLKSGGLVFCLWSGLVIVAASYYSSDALVPALDVRACTAHHGM